MKLVIVGGVAAGASAAAKARRIDENANITLFERGEYISFANCGLPYHVGEVIPERHNLLVMTPQAFNARFEIDVRTRQEVVAVNREDKTVSVKNLETGEEYQEPYDKLILATGARPSKPDIPGVDHERVMTLWTIPDMDKIKKLIDDGANSALIVGGGFIGVEAAENLRERGVKTVLVQRRSHLFPQLDHEMATPLATEMTAKGVELRFGDQVASITPAGEKKLRAKLVNGGEIETDFIIIAAGARPNSELAERAGLDLGVKQSVSVDEHLRTSDPDIYAAGDVTQVNHLPLGDPSMIPFAGPANRQGRMAAVNALGVGKETYSGSYGTFVCKVFDLTTAATGFNERALRESGTLFMKTYLYPASHAGYYPGAKHMHMKLLFTSEGAILGAQVVGAEGVEKRVDVIATAMQGGMTVRDLAQLELCYAPPYGAAKDPVNYAGFIATNMIDGVSDAVSPDAIPSDAFLLDVRQPGEVEAGAIPGAANIPLSELRGHLGDLPSDQRIVAICRVGLRGYVAERILKNHGFQASNLSGGYEFWKLFQNDFGG